MDSDRKWKVPEKSVLIYYNSERPMTFYLQCSQCISWFVEGSQASPSVHFILTWDSSSYPLSITIHKTADSPLLLFGRKSLIDFLKPGQLSIQCHTAGIRQQIHCTKTQKYFIVLCRMRTNPKVYKISCIPFM